MAKIKKKEVRALNVEELKSRIEELRRELIKENAQVATGTIPKSPGLIKSHKKNVARMLTIIKEKSKK